MRRFSLRRRTRPAFRAHDSFNEVGHDLNGSWQTEFYPAVWREGVRMDIKPRRANKRSAKRASRRQPIPATTMLESRTTIGFTAAQFLFYFPAPRTRSLPPAQDQPHHLCPGGRIRSGYVQERGGDGLVPAFCQYHGVLRGQAVPAPARSLC